MMNDERKDTDGDSSLIIHHSSLLEMASNRLADKADILLVHRRHADTPAVQNIDTLLAQFPHHLDRETGEGEHSALVEDKIEVVRHVQGFQRLDKPLSDAQNTRPHLGQLALPQLPQPAVT